MSFFKIPAYFNEKIYLWYKEKEKFNLDKKNLIFLIFLILFLGISLPIFPLYTTIGVLSVLLILVSFLCEDFLLLFLIISFGTSFRIGEGFMPVSFSMIEIVIYILIFIYFRDIIRVDLKRIVKEPIIFAFIIFLFSRTIFTGIHLQKDPTHMLSVIRDSIVPIFSLVLSIVLLQKFSIKKILRGWIAIGIIFAILGIIQSNTGKFLFLSEEGISERNYFEILLSGTIGIGQVATGLFGHHNTYSLYLQQILLISFVMYLLGEEEIHRISMLLIIGILLIGIFYTFSRGAYVTILFSIILLMLLYSNKTRIIGFILILLTGILVIKVIIPNFFIFFEQFETINARIYLWKSGMKVLENDPTNIIFGVGPGNFMKRAGTLYTAHNVYLLYLVETGIFVLLTLFYFIFTWLKHLFVKYKRAKDTWDKILYLGLFTASSGYFFHEIIEHSFGSVIFLSIYAFWIGIVSQYEYIQNKTR